MNELTFMEHWWNSTDRGKH